MATVKLDPAKGVQIPNLTTTERNAISSPETGALIWNTTTSAINQYNGSAWEITYTDTNTQVAGITSSADATAITIDSSENVGIGTASPSSALHVVGTVTANKFTLKYAGTDTFATIEGPNNRSLRFDLKDNGTSDIFEFRNTALDSLLKIDNTGHLTPLGGVYLGGTAAENKLDDYEEGTWTPVSATGSIDSTKFGRYTKVGNLVTIWCQAYNLVTDGGSGGFEITGLPFTTSATHGRAVGSVMMNSIQLFDTAVGGLCSYITDNSAAVAFYQNRKGTAWKQVLNSYISSGDDVMFSITYRTNS